MDDMLDIEEREDEGRGKTLTAPNKKKDDAGGREVTSIGRIKCDCVGDRRPRA